MSAMTDNSQVATTSSSSNVQTRDELCQEQSNMMREWVMSKMPPKLLPYFKNVKNAWDRTEIVMACLNDLNYKDIILAPRINTFTERITYTPFFKLNSLATALGYRRPGDLLKSDRSFNTHHRYTLPDIKDMKVCTRQKTEYEFPVIPDHLDNKSDPRRNDCLYIDMAACEELISMAMKQSKFKERAKDFKEILTITSDVTNAMIETLNSLITEYRLQQQTQQIQAIEADKKQMEEQKKRLEEETKLLALKKFPDTTIDKSHYGYIFSSPEYMANDLYKIGITDNLVNRERDAKTYCPTGSFLHTVESYDSRSTEQTIHIALKKHGLWHEISAGNEWFYLPSLDEAIKLLDMATNNTTLLYDYIATYAPTLRSKFTIAPKPSILAIKDDPSIDAIIASYVNDVVQYLITNNITCMSKTNMILLLRKTASDPKYKKKKDRLPTELEAFLTDKNIRGITLTKKPTKSQMKIEIETM